MSFKIDLPEAVSKSVDQILDTPRPRIDYTLFRQKYLALFNPAAWPNRNAPVRDWLEISNTEFQVVDCYDGDTFMFEIPPLLNRNGVGIGRTSGYRVQTEILRSIEEEGRMAPLGDAYVRRNILPEVVTPDTDIESVKQWERIFQHFGITKFPDSEGKSAFQVEVAGKSEGDESSANYSDDKPFATDFEEF